MNGAAYTPRLSTAGSTLERTNVYTSRLSTPTDARRMTSEQGRSPSAGLGGESPGSLGQASFGQQQAMTDLRAKLQATGDKLRKDIEALTLRDKTTRNDPVDLMSAGKERRNDVAINDEKVLEKIFADEKNKEIGALTCIDVCGKKETFVAGTKKMHVVCYNFKQNWFKLVKLKAKGAVTCIELSKNSEYIACGTEGGAVFLLRIKDNMVETAAKIEGFTKENILDVKFTDMGLSIAVLDEAEGLFHLNQDTTKSKPTFAAHIIQNNVKGAKLCHLKMLNIGRMDGSESKVKVLFVGGFHQSLLYKFHKGYFLQTDSLESAPIEAKTPRQTTLHDPAEDQYVSQCIEDYDLLPWIADTEIRLLYVVRGNMIYTRFAHLTANDELIINRFSEFRFSDNIIFAALVCPGVLLVIDQFSQIKFVNMRKVIKSQHETKDVDFTSAAYVTLKSVRLKDESLLSSDQAHGRQCKNYLPYMAAGRKGRFLMVATSKKLYTFELLDWKAYATNLEKEMDYLSAIQLLIELCEGDYYKLYGVSPFKDRRRAAMSGYIQDFVSALVQKKEVEKSTNPSAMIRILTSLLVKTGNVDYLFNTFYESMAAVNLQGELVYVIEEYIRSGQLGEFGPESLSGIIMEVFPSDLKKKLLLECFNVSPKKGQVINLTIHSRFYDLLYYMCPKHDAISCLFPVSLCLGELSVKAEQGQTGGEQDTLLRVLWYCETLMRGELMFREKIDQELVKQIQVTMIKWIIDPSNALALCRVDFLYYLDTLLLGLNQANMIVFQEHQYAEARKSDIYQFRLLNESSFKEFDRLLDEVHRSTAGNQQPYFALFLALLMVRGLPKLRLERSTIENVMATLVTQFENLCKDTRITLPDEEIQSVVFDIFTTNAAVLKDSREFTEAAEKCTNVFKVMMLENNDKYEETFLVYIKLVKDKLSHAPLFFQWLKRVFTDLNHKKGAATIAKPLVDSFPFLVEVGPREILAIWENFELQLKIETALSLTKNGKAQLDFMRRLMRLAENKDTKVRIPDKIKLTFFERLCEYNPEEVLQELKKNYWPTLECLEICQKHNVELGVAYINERLGKYMDALDIFIGRFARFANELRSKISGKGEKHFYAELMNDEATDGNMFKLHHQCSAIAQEYLEKLEEDHMMFKNLARVSDNKLEICYKWFSMLMKLKNMKVLNDDVIMRFLIDTFDEITNTTTVEAILEEVSKEKSELKLFESKELSLRFINSCKRNITNWEMMSYSLLDDTILLNNSLFKQKLKCLPGRDAYCDASFIPLREGNQIGIFDSGHKYLLENLNETARGRFVDEVTLRRSNNMVFFNAFSGDQWKGPRFKTDQEYRNEFYTTRGQPTKVVTDDFRNELERLQALEDTFDTSRSNIQSMTEQLLGNFSKSGIEKKIALPVLNFEHFDIS